MISWACDYSLIDFMLYLVLTIYSVCVELCCNRFSVIKRFIMVLLPIGSLVTFTWVSYVYGSVIDKLHILCMTENITTKLFVL